VTALSLIDAADFIVQRKILSAHEHYDYIDLHGNQLGIAEGNLLQVPPKFQIKDTHGTELLHMQGKTLSLHREFAFYSPDGAQLATIKKKVATFAGQEYWLEKDGAECMRIFGDFSNHQYQMECSGQSVAEVHRKWVTLRNEMGVSITGNVDHLLVIGAVTVIEHIETSENKSSSGTYNVRL
jgi:uncharacterized protein YxjI